MEFDWLLFLCISIIGPYFGSKMCAAMEKKVTGEVRFEDNFRKKRMKTTLISIVLSYIATLRIMVLIHENVAQDLSSILMRVLSILLGATVYLVFQRVTYRILLINS